MNFAERYQLWCNDPLIDEDLKEELLSLQDNPSEMEERFYQSIEFGTAGLRGVIQAGSNCMNTYNVKLASEALARTLKDGGTADKGIVIAYDSRHRSPQFAMAAALVFSAHHIPTYLFREITPVPILSFAVQHLKCAAGIVITASHNPSPYNGYKAYAAYGGQLDPEDSDKVLAHMTALSSLSQVKTMVEEEALASGILRYVADDLFDTYYQSILNGVLSRDAILAQKDYSIVYTPLHGSGNKPVRHLLESAGFRKVHVVKEQELPDGDFPTVKAPNPEEEEAMRLAVSEALQRNADLVIGTDPDADRMACCVRKGTEYTQLTGNQIASILLYYKLSVLKEQGKLPENGLICRSIVSTSLIDRIAESFGQTVTILLTGFRYASQQAARAAEAGRPFLFAFEESYGYLYQELSRDKDAVSSSLYLAEAAAYYKERGKTILDVLQDIYRIYGCQLEKVVTLSFPGLEGLAQMKAIMEEHRNTLPATLGGKAVVALRDYWNGQRVTPDACSPVAYPRADMIFYELDGGSWACLRPSGTEPKLKIYASAVSSTIEETQSLIDNILADLQTMLAHQD